MSSLTEFLDGLFREGRAVLRGPPEPPAAPDGQAIGLLSRAYAAYRLQTAGLLLDFVPEIGLAAARLVHGACWFLVHREMEASAMAPWLAPPRPPRSAADHLSADLTLRYLPPVYRRARAHDPADRLTQVLAKVLRAWPLSGVLADVPDEPLAPLDFHGHPGLLMLYAERLADHERPGWIPVEPHREHLELVYVELGKTPPAQLEKGRGSDE